MPGLRFACVYPGQRQAALARLRDDGGRAIVALHAVPVPDRDQDVGAIEKVTSGRVAAGCWPDLGHLVCAVKQRPELLTRGSGPEVGLVVLGREGQHGHEPRPRPAKQPVWHESICSLGQGGDDRPRLAGKGRRDPNRQGI